MRTPTFIFLVLCAVLQGCTNYHRVNITVKNTRGTAVPNASVQVSPMYFYNPTDDSFLVVGAYDILEPFPGKGAFGMTNEEGKVSLDIVEGNPSSLIVLAPNHQQWRGEISITEQNSIELIPPAVNTSDVIVTAE
jgi:hypothetical protein